MTSNLSPAPWALALAMMVPVRSVFDATLRSWLAALSSLRRSTLPKKNVRPRTIGPPIDAPLCHSVLGTRAVASGGSAGVAEAELMKKVRAAIELQTRLMTGALGVTPLARIVSTAVGLSGTVLA